MSKDPLMLDMLNPELIEQEVASKQKGKEKESTRINAEVAQKREERLQKGKAISSGPPMSAPPVVEEAPKDKSALLDKLGAYRDRFPDLKSRNKLSAKSTVEEIEDEIHYIEQQLGSKDGNLASTLFTTAIAGVEHVTAHHFNPLGLNLTGLTQVTRENQLEFAPILDELVIKYGAKMYVGPEMRLIGLVGTMMYTVHAANSGDARTANALRKMSATMQPPKTDL